MKFKETLKKFIPYNSGLQKILVFFYHISKYRWWRPKRLKSVSVSYILDRYSLQKEQIKFLQIGSNDGVESDPLRKFIIRDRWKGVLVEPLPVTFQKLLKNYQDYSYKDDLVFENLAISDKTDELPFYYIDANAANIPESSANKFSSFDKKIPLRLKWVHPSVENNIKVLNIKTVPLFDILHKHHLISTLNVLHIDTEGHDYVILQQLDFAMTQPDIILFENLHLKMEDYKKCISEIKRHDYVLFEHKLDTIAIKKDWKYKIFGS